MSQMQLVQATEEQKRERDFLTYSEWGDRLSIEQFLDREISLRKSPWCKKGMITWLLQDENQNTLSSCETFETPSLWSSKLRSPVEKAVSLGIGSVFTEPSYRGQGYAAEMIRQLIITFKKTRTAQALFCFSEIGAEYYQRLGFHPVSSEKWMISPKRKTDTSRVEPIPRDEWKSEWNTYFSPSTGFHFIIWPDEQTISWHLCRQDLYAQYLSRTIPNTVGAKLGNSAILWMADYKEDVLKILLLKSESPAESAALLSYACKVAHELELDSVQSWATAQEKVWQREDPFWQKLEILPRDESIAMICPLRPEIRAEDWGNIQRGIWI